jgi:hypothetical protein
MPINVMAVGRVTGAPSPVSTDQPTPPATTEETMSAIPHQTPFHERDADELLTLCEAAEGLRVPINTLRWWRQTGTGRSSSRSAATSSPPSETYVDTSANSGVASGSPRLKHEPLGGNHGKHRETFSCRQARLAGALPHTDRHATQQDLYAQDRRRAVLSHDRSGQEHGHLHRPGARADHGR